ncbi:MAG: energy transducer TonB family protein [Vicinamibacterales bacterium]
MYFDFDDRYTDVEPVGRAINRRDGVAVSMIVHAAILLAVLFLPDYLPARQVAEPVEPVRRRDDQSRNFVFVQPRVDLQALRPPERADLSDADRKARTVERAPKPSNSLPFARGDSPERVESSPEERLRGRGPAPEPAPPAPTPSPEVPTQAEKDLALMQKPAAQPPPGGSLGEALRNLQKYVQNESFNNQGGGNTQEFGPAIQFDTKGVEFGPWIRRFVSQVRRNWFVPYAAMSMRGRVIITFYVHRSGAITDVTVVRPSEIDSFNTAAVNALLASSPTEPLPKEYPDARAFFTVTFFYNEAPPGQ